MNSLASKLDLQRIALFEKSNKALIQYLLTICYFSPTLTVSTHPATNDLLHTFCDMTQLAAGRATAGVLPIPVAATQKSTTPAKKTPKPPAPRLKLLIRRLPPGLTQAELETALGQEWKVGAGKVDWLQYKPGKVSKE